MAAHRGAAGGWCLGVDGGGTKTVAVVATETGDVLGIGHGGPVNIGWVGRERAAESLRQAVTEAFSAAGVQGGDCAAAYLGMAGVDSDEQDDPERVTFLDALGKSGIPPAVCVVDNDAYIGMAAALGPGPGVGVVAGTGFIAVAVGPGGRRKVMPWYVAGRGAGHILGRLAAMAALFHLRGVGQETGITARVLATLGATGAADVEAWLAERHTSRDLGALAPALAAAAGDGDSLAADMLRTAGLEFGLAAVFVARAAALDVGPGPCRVATIGGVFRAGPIVTDAMAAVLGASGIRAELIPPRMAPVGGAVLLAWHARGLLPTPAAVDRLVERIRSLLPER